MMPQIFSLGPVVTRRDILLLLQFCHFFIMTSVSAKIIYGFCASDDCFEHFYAKGIGWPE